ncbi:LysR family transcriptional regulator, partial [Escherichia coli]|nr:LysR family transcriptional regulator [Escherichia coli]
MYRRDLNLLVALRVLIEENSVSKAATRLNLSQSAMSRVLGRLRDLLGDPLFT